MPDLAVTNVVGFSAFGAGRCKCLGSCCAICVGPKHVLEVVSHEQFMKRASSPAGSHSLRLLRALQGTDIAKKWGYTESRCAKGRVTLTRVKGSYLVQYVLCGTIYTVALLTENHSFSRA